MMGRRAFTLVELMCALVLVAIVGTTIGRLLVGQQRFYEAIGERLAMRSQLHDGADAFTIALRHAAVQGAPIVLATDTAVELSTMIGAGTVCGASGAQLDLAPEAPTSGIALSALAMTPDSADDVLVYGGAPAAPRRWSRTRIVTVASRPASALCAASPLLSVADVANGRVTELTTNPPVSAAAGSPVRVVRPVRLDVYRASDGLYYLGYRRCGVGCSQVQPVSGPYGAKGGGVTFRYFDVTGAILATPVPAGGIARITRIDIVLRASSRSVIDLPGSGRGIARDSTLVSVALRNAP